MLDKIKGILGSIRFWQLVLAAAIKILSVYEVIPTEVANTIVVLLGASVFVGTADKGAKMLATGK